jgi:RNA polymerase sigma-70 factor, ECF subfamily
VTVCESGAVSGTLHLSTEADLVEAARAGDRAAFDLLVPPLRPRLHLHCYRLLGTLDDADDAVQETLLRAWRHLGGFEPRNPMLAWLYRIATNVCLTKLRQRSARGTGSELLMDPYPDELLRGIDGADPSAITEGRESIRLAFTAAVQMLPPRQRAALLLRDVLGYSANEAAAMMETSVAAVNSGVQRARSTLRQPAEPIARDHLPPGTSAEAALVRRFVSAWERADVDGLIEILTNDALVAMPPEPERFVGREAIREFLRTGPADERRGRFRLLPTRANDQPALAAYLRTEPDGTYDAHAIMVLSLHGDDIASVTRFGGSAIVRRFGFPPLLSGGWRDR